MPIGQITTVVFVFSNAKRAKEWHKDNLGFEVQADIENLIHSWSVVGPPRSSTGIHLCQSNEPIPLELGNTGIVFVAADIEGTYQGIERKGVEFTRELGKGVWDENMKYAWLKDPDGNEFRLMPKD